MKEQFPATHLLPPHFQDGSSRLPHTPTHSFSLLQYTLFLFFPGRQSLFPSSTRSHSPPQHSFFPLITQDTISLTFPAHTITPHTSTYSHSLSQDTISLPLPRTHLPYISLLWECFLIAMIAWWFVQIHTPFITYYCSILSRVSHFYDRGRVGSFA